MKVQFKCADVDESIVLANTISVLLEQGGADVHRDRGAYYAGDVYCLIRKFTYGRESYFRVMHSCVRETHSDYNTLTPEMLGV